MIDKIKNTPNNKIYIHPALEKLKQHDLKYNTDYVTTLKEFILSFKDLSHTADKLNIHRNSLKYRLQKIAGISNIDFSDQLLCAQLLCNFYMISDDTTTSKTPM